MNDGFSGATNGMKRRRTMAEYALFYADEGLRVLPLLDAEVRQICCIVPSCLNHPHIEPFMYA